MYKLGSCNQCGRKFVGTENVDCGNCESMEVIEAPKERWTIVYPVLVVGMAWLSAFILL